MKKYATLLLIAVLVLIHTACASSAHVKITDTNYVDLTITLLPSGTLENTVKKLASGSGASSVFQEKEIRKSFEAQKIIVQNLQLTGFCGLKLSCSIPGNHQLLKKLVYHEPAKKTVALRVSPHTVQQLLALIPEENRDFVDILMAPLVTGEKISVEEYRETIGTIYGPKMVTGLDQSIFTIVLESPYQVQICSVKPIGKIAEQTQSKVTVGIPLIELLCMTDTLTIDVQGR
ncbi:MAG: hypothetical protein ACTTJ7_00630 [Treponema sp.]